MKAVKAQYYILVEAASQVQKKIKIEMLFIRGIGEKTQQIGERKPLHFPEVTLLLQNKWENPSDLTWVK